MDSNNPYSAPTASIQETPGATQDIENIRIGHIRHEVSLKSIGTLYGLGALLMGVLVLMSFSFLFGEFSNAEPRGTFLVVTVFYGGLGAVLLAMAFGFRKLSPWVKYPGSLFAVIGLLGFPIGTLINGYILYLIWCKKGQVVLGSAYQDIIAATPHVKYKRSLGDKIAMGIVLALLVGFGALLFVSIRS